MRKLKRALYVIKMNYKYYVAQINILRSVMQEEAEDRILVMAEKITAERKQLYGEVF